MARKGALDLDGHTDGSVRSGGLMKGTCNACPVGRGISIIGFVMHVVSSYRISPARSGGSSRRLPLPECTTGSARCSAACGFHTSSRTKAKIMVIQWPATLQCLTADVATLLLSPCDCVERMLLQN
ncbi:hypothetical protein BaRGS_00038200 [Batillaria attramentaria]|uniref:Uncharacterized protein n=1 Tax=Batillaria attramentaria TaxID=370345 RepID=A0ABD0J7J6_9CAEN